MVSLKVIVSLIWGPEVQGQGSGGLAPSGGSEGNPLPISLPAAGGHLQSVAFLGAALGP